MFFEANAVVIVLSCLLFLLSFVGYVVSCIEMTKVAVDKGHQSVNAVVLFFLGIPYMIYVASLPDLKARNNASQTSVQKSNVSAPVPETQSSSQPAKVKLHFDYTDTVSNKQNTNNAYPNVKWECPNCHAVNLVSKRICSCGTNKPA